MVGEVVSRGPLMQRGYSPPATQTIFRVDVSTKIRDDDMPMSVLNCLKKILTGSELRDQRCREMSLSQW